MKYSYVCIRYKKVGISFWEDVRREQYSVICGDFDYFYVVALKSN